MHIKTLMIEMESYGCQQKENPGKIPLLHIISRSKGERI